MTSFDPHMRLFAENVVSDNQVQFGSPDEDNLLMEGLKDIPRGIAGGVIGFGQSLGDIVDTGAEQFGFDIADDSMWSSESRPEWAQTKTVFGGLVTGVTQAALAFVPVAGIAGRLSAAARGATTISKVIEGGGLAGRAASILTSQGMIGGALVDAYAFKGDEGHFADLLRDLGGPGDNVVTRWLSTDEDDTWLEGRAKNVVEGAILGAGWDAIVEPVMRAFKGKPDWDKKALFQDAKRSAEQGLMPPELAEQMVGAKWESFKLPDTEQRKAFQAQLRESTGDDQVTAASMAVTDAFVKTLAETKGISVDEAYGQVFAGVQRVGGPNISPEKQIQYNRLLSERYTVGPDHPLYAQGKKSDVSGRNWVDQPNLKSILPNPTSVWHQTTPENAAKIFAEFKKAGSQFDSLYVSDNKDLAIGQGKTGVTIEFDPERINGFKNEKPGTFLDGAEYRITKGSPGAIKNITFDTPKAEQAFAKKYPDLYATFKERAQAPRGATSFTEDGRAVITLMRNSDPTTVLHELSHVFRRQLDGISEEMSSVAARWAGVEPGSAWSREAEEKWATAFEKYLSDGQAPTPELQSVFEKVANWVKDVYRGIIGSPVASELSPEIRNVFDAMLGAGWNRHDPSLGKPLSIPSNRPIKTLQDLRGTRAGRYIDVDPEDTARITRANTSAVTSGPEVEKAYTALDTEVTQAFSKISEAGITVVPWTKQGLPYDSVQALQADITANKRVFVPAVYQEFTAYRGTKAGSPVDAPGVGQSRFFSPDENVAKAYAGTGGTVTKETLRFSNPLVTKNWVMAKRELGIPTSSTMEELLNSARSKGHDGVVFQDHNGTPEYVSLGSPAEPQVDKLSAVRMVFGHAADGFRFDERGTENAYRVLSKMFSQDALPALHAQTRGVPLGGPPGPRGIVTLFQDSPAKDLLDTYKKAAEKTTSKMQAAQEAVGYHINHGRLDVDGDVSEFLKGVEGVTQDLLKDKKTLKDLYNMAVKDGVDPDVILKALEDETSQAYKSAVLSIKARLGRNELASRAALLSRQFLENTDRALMPDMEANLINAIKALERFDTVAAEFQRQTATAVSSGNLTVGIERGTPTEEALLDLAKDKAAQGEKELADALEDYLGKEKPTDPPGKPKGPSGDPKGPKGILDVIDDPTLSPEERIKKIRDIAEGIIIADGTGQTGTHLKRIKEAHKAGKLEQLMEVQKASLLSGIPTLVLNMTSPAFQAITQPLAKVLGSLYMRDPAGAKDGFRLMYNTVASIKDVIVATLHAPTGQGSRGLRPVMEVARTEQPGLTGVLGAEHRHAITPESYGTTTATLQGKVIHAVGRFVRLPFTASGMSEEMWNQITYLAYVRTKALREADNAIWNNAGIPMAQKAAAAAQFVDAYVKQAFDPNGRATVVGNEFFHDDAIRYAKSINFTTELGKGTLGNWLMDGKARHPWMDMIIPFVRVPTNIVRTAIRMTPGASQLWEKYVGRNLDRTPDEIARQKGELLVGSTLWGYSMYLAASGQITGGGPTNKAERDALMATGWRPYSLISQDEQGRTIYTEFRRFDPFATVLGIAADMSEGWSQFRQGERDQLSTIAVMALANNLTSKTYLQGITELSRALTGGQSGEAYLRNKASSFIPNFAARYATADDPYMREVRTLTDAFKRRLPGYSTDLAPRRDLLGQPVSPPPGFMLFNDPTSTGPETAFSRAVSPVAFSARTPDVVRNEMSNLAHGFTPPARKMDGIDLTTLKSKSGQDAYDRLQELTGTLKINGKDLQSALEAFITSDRYRNLPEPESRADNDNPRIRAISRIMSRYRQAARVRLYQEFPELRAARRGEDRPVLTSNDNPLLQALNR